MRNLLPVLIFGFCWLGAGQTIPPWFPKTPPLSPPHGEVIRVGITDELLAAATGALEQGVPLAEVIEDIRGRPRTGSPDLGAWQSERETNFTNGSASAKKFGTHEIVLMGQGNVANPFDTAVTVKFTPPSGSANAVAVDAFYDGGNAWRARMYVTEAGRWKWISTSATDRLLDRQSGTFLALPSNLRGRLRKHQANPRAWMTEDGRWFANISDTGYRLFHAQAAPLWQEFIRNSAAQGITCMRAACLGGWGGTPNAGVDDRVSDGDGRTGRRRPKLMERDKSEFLVYHPNAVADGKAARVDESKTARMRLDLRDAPETFQVEWFRAYDGVSAQGDPMEGAITAS